jgi:hypothetical protein
VVDKEMPPVVKQIRRELDYGMLPWIDDFLCAPTDRRRPATGRVCRRAGKLLDLLFRELRLHRHPDKGRWEGAQVPEHLGVLGTTPDAGVRIGPQDPADEEDGAGYSVVRSMKSTVGVPRKIATFLRGGGVVDFVSAHGQVLLTKSVLGHEPGWTARDGQAKSSRSPGLNRAR